MRHILSSVAAAGLMMTAACASYDGDEQAKTDPRIGEKVDRICFGRTIDGWRDVKGQDNVVLLQRGVNDWYYAELTGACRSNALRSAIAIGIDSRPAGGCITRGDAIIVEDSPGFTQRCVITDIYEWDEDAPAPAEDEDDMM